MTKSELIDRLHALNPHFRYNEAEQVIETIFEEISKAIAEDKRVELRGFGVFFLKKRKARTGRNPRTGEAVKVEGKSLPFFKPGRPVYGLLNGLSADDSNPQA